MIWRIKSPTKIAEGLTKIISTIKDLIQLSERHDIEAKLYNSEALDKIYKIIGDGRVTKFLTNIYDENLEGEILWKRLIKFLEKDLNIQQQKIIINENTKTRDSRPPERTPKPIPIHHSQNRQSIPDDLTCHICGKNDHVPTRGPGGSKLIQYFSCKEFVDLKPFDRFQLLKRKGLCYQCLYPGAKITDLKHSEGRCQRDYTCKHASHNKFPRGKHVLVCSEHKDQEENKQIFEMYKFKCILKQKYIQLPEFSKEIKLSFHLDQPNISPQLPVQPSVACSSNSSTNQDAAVFQIQTIKINNQRYSIFFDSGCGDFVSRYKAVCSLTTNATQEYPGPITIGGVGGLTSLSQHGIYKVKIPLHDGSQATMSGVCLDNITSTFPTYPLQGQVINDIIKAYKRAGGNAKDLPITSKYVGGDIDFMIGIKYLRYHPRAIFQLPSGLTIYESVFENADGGRGVIGGPHKVFNSIKKHQAQDNIQLTFFSDQYNLYRNGYQVNPDISMLGYTEFKQQYDVYNCHDIKDENSKEAFVVKSQRLFNQAEEAGSEIMYRCINCRSCKTCKDHDQIELTSIKEEVEQDLINQSVVVDFTNRQTTAKLPLLHNPTIKLCPNKYKAIKVYNQQVKKLNNNPDDKEQIINSEKKLQDLGHVDYVRNLPDHLQEILKNSPVQNFIPWRVVWKGSSISTPCRVVFDASQITDTGYSLNDVIAKGRNNMNKLVEIVIRWYMHKIAFHTDIQKMYNSVKLHEEHWCLQRYIWHQDLDPTKIPEEKVIKTLIYGVKSSGNQAERGLRETAKLSQDEYPDINQIVSKDIYVDDCISGGNSLRQTSKLADDLEIVLNRGGFHLKGITFSKKDPPESLSSDRKSISVAGMLWFPKDDEISLDIKEMNFAKKRRGRKPTSTINVIPSKLTRRHCVSKVSEIFDLTGKVTPLTAAMKLDLHDLVKQNLDWDDAIPDNLQPIWDSHFQMMNEIKTIKYQRAVIPDNAINTNAETLDFGDASKDIACVAIYARFKRQDGSYSCQLVFSRSRLIPDNTTQPRAELYAALINAHTGEVVKRAFGEHHKSALKFTDSQIVLHWISNENRPLKQWVRNRIIEINRFTTSDQWRYIHTSNMIADIGTRRGVKLEDVDQNSSWINGLPWMKMNTANFPMKTVNEISLNTDELEHIKQEVPSNKEFENSFNNHDTTSISMHQETIIPDEVSTRYKFSNYIIDPNKYRFTKVIRILAYIIKFISNIKKIKLNLSSSTSKTSNQHNLPTLTEIDLTTAADYYFKKATLEVKQFVKESQYSKFSREKDGKLIYTGRILPTDTSTITGSLTKAMQDLSVTTFCIPLVDKHSPIAYAIINEVHWHDNVAQHAGVETVWRFVLKRAYIIEGRSIVKTIKRNCQRCRYLKKKTIDIAMGPLSECNLKIAPAFYNTQLDIAGPFKAYSRHNKRTTLKIWLVVFCCTTTSTVNIKVMEDYSSISFIQAFTRFACEVGYPKKLLPDEGSQLLKGCSSMKLDIRDIKSKLQTNVTVDFEVCPVGGHNMHGKVERKIQEIKKSIEKTISNERLSVIQWETCAAEIANRINDLPLALGNVVADFDTMDLITPNRLRLGPNNNRSPCGNVTITSDVKMILQTNQNIFNSWFENWLLSHVPNIMHQPKWFRTEYDLKEGDIVLFLKQDSTINKTYQYGMIKSVEKSSDGIIRKVWVKYRNANESTDRETYRSARQLVMIHPVDELDIILSLNDIGMSTQQSQLKRL